MTLNELQNSIRELGAKIRAAAVKLSAAAADGNTPMADLQKQQADMADMQARFSALQASYDAQYKEGVSTLPDATDPGQEKSLKAMRKSNEYARAFARAIRTGAHPSRPMTDEKTKVLYDALTIGGGDPAGEDGGFLVPEDLDTQIREKRKALNPLADLFNVEPTSSSKGWRIMDKAPTTGMTLLSSEIPDLGIPMDDQPAFVRVDFALSTFGLLIPVSRELANDEDANLFSYLAGWYAKKQIITENLLLRAKLETLVASNIATTDKTLVLPQIKTVLNVSLDPENSLMAVILTNQNGYNYLDGLTAEDGRPLLQPDPTSATGMMLKGRPVRMMPNWLLPTRVVTDVGATKGDYHPMYIGDFAQFATLFSRQPLEIASTDIGGEAFRKNSIEVRGISRMTATKFDDEAAVRREIFIAGE